MNPNADSAVFTRLLDDLLWVHARKWNDDDGLSTAVNAMIADYTPDPDHYSDGSPVGVDYILDDFPNVILYDALPPPHRRTAE
jgi:hypothetical protein